MEKKKKKCLSLTAFAGSHCVFGEGLGEEGSRCQGRNPGQLNSFLLQVFFSPSVFPGQGWLSRFDKAFPSIVILYGLWALRSVPPLSPSPLFLSLSS